MQDALALRSHPFCIHIYSICMYNNNSTSTSNTDHGQPAPQALPLPPRASSPCHTAHDATPRRAFPACGPPPFHVPSPPFPPTIRTIAPYATCSPSPKPSNTCLLTGRAGRTLGMHCGQQSALTPPGCSTTVWPPRLRSRLSTLLLGGGLNNLPNDVPSELSGAMLLDLWTRALPHIATYILRLSHVLRMDVLRQKGQAPSHSLSRRGRRPHG